MCVEAFITNLGLQELNNQLRYGSINYLWALMASKHCQLLLFAEWLKMTTFCKSYKFMSGKVHREWNLKHEYALIWPNSHSF